MLEVYVLTGAQIYFQIFNAIAALFSSSDWATVTRWALYIAVLGGMIRFIGTKDLVKLVRWVFIYVFVIGVLIIPKKSIHIIDLSDRTVFYKVDNVPLGIAMIYSYGTTIGFSIAQLYDTFFSLPDAMTYSKTGFLFGETLARDSLSITNGTAELNETYNNYISNCVLGDIMLNNKYSMRELIESNDIFELITRSPSPIRRLIVNDGKTRQNVSCKEAASTLKVLIGSAFDVGVPFISNLSQSMYTTSRDKSNILRSLLQDSYQYIYGTSKTASQILRQNFSMGAIRTGLKHYSGNQNDVAGLINLTAEDSQMKSRLNWAVSSQIATTYLPLLHTVLILLLLGLLPIVLIVTISDVMGTKPLQLYVLSLVYFMSWIPLYSILHYIMVFYTQSSLSGVVPVLSNVNKIKLIHSDISMIAGYLSLSIPFLALGIVKGFSAVVTNASNFVGSSITSAASQSSSSAASGNWSIGNISTENVTGFKWDTNYNHANGMIAQQLANGAIKTITPSGNIIYNTQSAQSYLPTTADKSSNIQSLYSQSIRLAEDQAIDASRNVQIASREMDNNLTQLNNVLNKQDSVNSFKSVDDYTSIKKATSDANNAVDAYATIHNVTRSEAITYLNNKTSNGSIGGTIGGGVGAGIGDQIVEDNNTKDKGKVKNGVNARAGIDIGGRYSTGSSDSIYDNSGNAMNFNHNRDASYARQYQLALDKVANYKFTDSSGRTDSDVTGLIRNTSASYEKTIAATDTYTKKEGIVNALNKDASYVQNNSSSIQSNLNSEFVQWYQGTNPEKAERILSDTTEPSIREEREELFSQYVDDKIKSRIQNIFNNNKANIKNEYTEKTSDLYSDKFNLDPSKSYNDSSSKIVTDAYEKGIKTEKEIVDQTQIINDDINFNMNVNSSVLSDRENELKIEKEEQKIKHKNETEKAVNIQKEANDNQSFQSDNPVRKTILEDKQKGDFK